MKTAEVSGSKQMFQGVPRGRLVYGVLLLLAWIPIAIAVASEFRPLQRAAVKLASARVAPAATELATAPSSADAHPLAVARAQGGAPCQADGAPR